MCVFVFYTPRCVLYPSLLLCFIPLTRKFFAAGAIIAGREKVCCGRYIVFIPLVQNRVYTPCPPPVFVPRLTGGTNPLYHPLCSAPLLQEKRLWVPRLTRLKERQTYAPTCVGAKMHTWVPCSALAKMHTCVDVYTLPREGVNVRRGVGMMRSLRRSSAFLGSLPN